MQIDIIEEFVESESMNDYAGCIVKIDARCESDNSLESDTLSLITL